MGGGTQRTAKTIYTRRLSTTNLVRNALDRSVWRISLYSCWNPVTLVLSPQMTCCWLLLLQLPVGCRGRIHHTKNGQDFRWFHDQRTPRKKPPTTQRGKDPALSKPAIPSCFGIGGSGWFKQRVRGWITGHVVAYNLRSRMLSGSRSRPSLSASGRRSQLAPSLLLLAAVATS